MRIIAGTARGTRLAPVPAGARPVSDRAREGLFSSLGPEVHGARVLDLFAGTGALGIEALSRGAAHAVFVDSSREAVQAIRANLDRTRPSGGSEVVRRDVRAYLAGLPVPAVDERPFDLVFADPPYDLPEGPVSTVLSTSVERCRPAALILTRPRRGDTDVIPVHWAVARTLRYGDSLVLIIREELGARKRPVSGDV